MRRHNDIWCKRKQLSSVAAMPVDITGGPAIVDANVAVDGPAQFVQALLENLNLDTGRSFRIVRSKGHQHADASHPLALLRARRVRPCRYAVGHRLSSRQKPLCKLFAGSGPRGSARSSLGQT